MDKPDKPTGSYYALIERGRKQFRRSLKTADHKLAQRRLAELKNRIGNLVGADETDLSFAATADLVYELDADGKQLRVAS